MRTNNTEVVRKIIKTKDGNKFVVRLLNNKLVLTNEILDYVESNPSFILKLVTFDLTDSDKEILKKFNRFFYKKSFCDDVRYYLNQILLSDNIAVYFKRLQRLGVLKGLMPELNACTKIQQRNKFHKFNVFEHCVYTAEYLDKDIVLRLAGLLHDVGKAKTYRIINGKITFHKHNFQGAIIVSTILRRIGYSRQVVKEVAKLVDMHMYYYTNSWTDKAVKKFIKNANITETNINALSELPLFKLRAADRIGSGVKHTAVTELQKKFQDKIRKVFYEK